MKSRTEESALGLFWHVPGLKSARPRHK